MLRRPWTVFCLAFGLAGVQALADPSDTVQADRRLLASRDCDVRVTGVRRLLDKVPPTELFDAAWECADRANAYPDTQRDAREALRKLVNRRAGSWSRRSSPR